MAKFGLSREAPRKSSLLESRREAYEEWVRVWVPKEVWIREIERVLGRQLACRRVYARAPLMPQTSENVATKPCGSEFRWALETRMVASNRRDQSSRVKTAACGRARGPQLALNAVSTKGRRCAGRTRTSAAIGEVCPVSTTS
jgi:hypothetical protein